jgi:hypothetical protein
LESWRVGDPIAIRLEKEKRKKQSIINNSKAEIHPKRFKPVLSGAEGNQACPECQSKGTRYLTIHSSIQPFIPKFSHSQILNSKFLILNYLIWHIWRIKSEIF